MNDIIEYTTKQLIQRANHIYGTEVMVPKISYKHNTDDWMGQARYHPDEGYALEFSQDFVMLDLDWVLEEIIPHEVAHLVDFWMCFHHENIVELHNDRWRDIAIRLGSSGKINPEYII
jgi:predicted SprT family Zn-dependent metalloprotease